MCINGGFSSNGLIISEKDKEFLKENVSKCKFIRKKMGLENLVLQQFNGVI